MQAKIGTLSSLHPRPTVMKIPVLYTHIRKVLATIPSFQSPNHGYQGIVDAAEIYALTREAAWIDFPDPGFYRQADRTLNPVIQHTADAIFSAAIIAYRSQ